MDRISKEHAKKFYSIILKSYIENNYEKDLKSVRLHLEILNLFIDVQSKIEKLKEE